jgi:hypothetical protein
MTMHTSSLGRFVRFGGERYASAYTLVNHLGWPVLAAAFLMATSLVALGFAGWMHSETTQIRQNLEHTSTQATGTTVPTDIGSNATPLSTLPSDTTYLKDLGQILKFSSDLAINSGVVEYKLESNPKIPVAVRFIDIHVNEDYPKIKRFLSALLDAFPHMALREIRMERRDPSASQGTALLKFSLVYSNDTLRPAVPVAPPTALPGKP